MTNYASVMCGRLSGGFGFELVNCCILTVHVACVVRVCVSLCVLSLVHAGCSLVFQSMTWLLLHTMLFAMTCRFSGESEALWMQVGGC